MNFFLLITDANGESRLVPIEDVQNIPVSPGDDVVVMDEKGNPVDVSLRPEGDDLVVDLGDGTKAILEDFYNQEEGADPVTISLNPIEPVGEDYDFNSQTGNLPDGKSFTLMRFSNTEYIQFVEQLDDLNVGHLLNGIGSPGGFGLSGGGGAECCDDEDLILDPVPAAAPDAGAGAAGTPIVIDLLSNDTDSLGGGLMIHSVGGIGVAAGSTITLQSGSVVTVNADGTIDFLAGSSFDALQEGESGVETFIYSIKDAGGNIATSEVSVVVEGINDPPVAKPDEFDLSEDAPITVDVLNNDSDPDTSDTLTVTGVDAPPSGTIMINGDNTLTFDPAGSFESLAVGETATVTLTYEISDDRGATATSTVTFVVNGENDTPDAVDDGATTDQGLPVTIDVLTNDTDPDASDTLTVTGVSQPTSGSVIYNSGDVTFDPGSEFDYLDAGESATVTFAYDISDGNGGTDTATVTVTINGVDDATITNPDAGITNEDTAVTIDVLANDSDVDSSDNPLMVGSVTQPTDANDGAVVNNGGDVTFTPGSNFNSLAVGESATTTFTYTTDTGITEDVTVTVHGVNDAPAAVDDADVTDQDTPITVDVLTNDTDPDASDALIISGLDQPAKGSATVNSDNEIVFDPGTDFDDLDAGESATVTFDYTISDGNGGSDTATVTITVNGVDDATVTNPDADITDEDTAVTIDVLANDSDVDSSDNPLMVASVAQPTDVNDGTVVNNGGDVTFTPGSNFNSLAVGESATTTFTYTTDTGVTEDVTVTVHGVNDGPAAVDDADVTDQNTAITIDAIANDSDPDSSDVLLITGVDQPSKGSASVDSNNQIVFDPGSDFDDLDAGESATVTFDYNISDGNGGTATATVTVTVNGTDDATVTNPDADITDEETAVTIDVLANDSDVDASDNPLMVASVAQPTDVNDGTVVNNGGDVTFTPGSNFNSLAVGESATTTFTYTTDTGVTENVTVTINGVNDGPAAADDADVTDQDTPITIDVVANDSDPDTSDVLLIEGVGQPPKGSASIDENNQIVFDPGSYFDDLDAGESATVTFDYTVSDGNGGTATATVTVTVNGVDDATVTNPDMDITNEDAAVTIDVLANDSDVDSSDNPLMVASVTQPTDANDGTVVNNGGDVTFTPGSNFNSLAVGESATTTFTYTTDTGITEDVTVTINGVNDAPAAVDDADVTDQDTPITVDVLTNDSDPDASDALIISGVDQPSKGSATVNSDNEIVFDPGTDFDDLDAGESATVTFDYTISDGNGGSDTATVTITVNGVDDATVTNPDADITDEDTAVTIDVLANDSDVDSSDNPLMVASVAQPTDVNDGTVVNNGGDVTFTPGSNFNSLAVGESATTTFTYTTDTGVTEDVTVTINGRNDGPTANPDADVTDQETTITIDAVANDTDPDSSDVLLITGVEQPSKGSVTIDDNNQLVFDPNSEFDDLDAGESATVTFDYNVSDGNGGTATATVTVTVNGTDDATVTNPDADITDEDTAVTIDVLANDSDVDSSDNPLMVASVTQPTDANDGMVVNNGGDVTFTPGSNFNSLAVGESATTTFTYTTDTGVTEDVTVTINGVNDGPAAVDDARTTDQDTAITIDATANDSDPDSSDVLLITGVDQPGKGSASVDSNNQIVFDPGSDFDDLDAGESATVTFDYNISDGNGGTATATVTVTVNGADDTTVTNPDADITDEDTAVTIDVLANDSDVDSSDNPLMVASVTQPTDANDGMVVNNGGDVTFTPGSNFNSLAVGESATTTFTYTTDTGVTEDVTVTINGVNDGPGAVDDADVTDQDTPITIDALANDSDPDSSDVLLITGVDQPSKGSATVDSNNQIVFDPGSDFDDLDAGESATVTFDYNISDGNGGTATATVTVTVNGTDDATVTNPDADITDEDTAVTIDVLANDSDVDSSDNPLMVASVTQPTDANDGAVVNNGGDVTFTPGSNFNSLAVGESATTTFTYTTDTGITEDVTVTINGVNDGPTATDDADVTDQDTPITIDAIANDSDPDSSDVLLITGVDQPSKGSATVDSNNQIVFDPGSDFDDLDAGESATVTFDYNISDGNGGTATATVTVTVNGTDDATVTNPDADITDEDTAVTIDVLANDSDVDSSDNPLMVASVTQPTDANDGAVVNNGVDVTFTPGSNFNSLAVGESATTTFTYTTDTGVTEDVTVTINGVNDAPAAVDDADVTDQDTPITVDVLTNDSDPDASDALIISGVDQPGKGSATVNSDNEIVFDPGSDFDDLDAGESATVTFDYTISDGNGGEDTATVTITVNGADDGTVTNPDADITDEDTAVTIDVLANDSDVDSSDNPLMVASVAQPTDANDGTVVNNGTDVTFTPGSNFNSLAVGESATTTFTYTTDTGVTEDVTVTINGVNDGPTATDDADVTDQDTPITIDAIANDSDPDSSDVLLITGVDQPSKGSASVDSNNQIVFDPGSDFDDLDAGESATVTFDYNISDGSGGTATATVTVTVNGVDDATVTNPDADITDEDTVVTIDVLANDSDVDSSDNPLMVASVTQPTDANDGAVVNNGGDVTFTPGSNFNSLAVGESATTTFTYTTDTGVTEDVTVTINGVNDAPAAVDDADVTDQDTPITVDVLTNDSDPDGSDALIISGVDQPSKGSATVNSNSEIVFDPGSDFDDLDAGESATVSFDYTISDGNGGSDTATVTITVNGVDDATVTNPDADITNEDTAVTIDVLANDSDVDSSDNPLMVASVTQPTDGNDGAVVNNGGDVTFTPGTNFNSLAVGESATTTFTYTTDTGITENVTVTVNGVNDAPDAVDDADVTDQNTAITIDTLVNDTDPDSNDSLLITGVTQPTLGSVSYNVGDVTFDPGDDFDDLDAGESATVTFTYDITDGNGGTDTATVTVTVNGVEDATVTNPDVDTTDEDTAVTIDVLANDSDPDTSDNPLMVASVTQPTDVNDGTVVNNGGDVTFTPGSNFNSLGVGESATTTFTYTTDTGSTENVTVTVNGVNDAPSAVDDAEVTDQNTAITIDAVDNDVDPDTSDTLIITSVNQPSKGSTSIDANNEIVFDPGSEFDDLDAGESATVTFDYSISDGNGGTDTATVTVTVNGVDDATVTNPDADVTNESTPVTIDVLTNDSDPDTSDNPLMVASVTQPTDGNDGSVVNNGTDVTFTPGSNFNSLAVGESATTTFTYTTDTGATETVTVTVNGQNDAPMANDDGDSTNQGVPVTVDVLMNDTDPDTSDDLEITGVTQPTKGSVTYNSGDLTFDPGSEFDDLDAGESETVTFTYSMSDGNGGTDTATVTLTVNGTDDPTVTNPDEDTTNEGSPVTIDVLTNDSDPDASDNPLMIASVTQPTDGNDGTAVNNGTDVTFTPGSNFESLAVGESATTTFTYTTVSGATETVTVTVNGLNDGPTAVDDMDSTDQDTVITIDATSNDTDPDTSDNLTITSVDQPAKGSAAINSSNQIVFNPGNDFDDLDAGESATVTFDYNISDGNGGMDTATVTVTVNGVDDPTVTNPDQGSTFEGSPVTVNVISNDNDPDTSDNPLTVASVTQPVDGNDGSVVFAGGNVTFTPGSNFDSLSPGESATTTFTYTTNTGAMETVTVTINGLDDPTVTAPDSDTTDEDSPVTIDVLANDVDPDTVDNPLTISNVTQPNDSNDGTVVNNGTDVTFTPGSNFDSLGPGDSGTTTFTYTTDTGQTENVTVTVTGINDAPVANDDFVVSTTDIDPVTINVVSNDTDVDGTVDPNTVDLDTVTAGIQSTLAVAGEGTWTSNGAGGVTFTPDPALTNQPTAINYSVADNDGATSIATITLKYSAADVWFGNDESGSVDGPDFDQSRVLISGAADQMSFATGDLAFNAALFTWAGTGDQQSELALTSDQTQFVNDSANYSRNFAGPTDIGQGIVFGTQLINTSVAARQLAMDPRADVPQVMVILTDASSGQILGDTSLLADAQAAKDAGIILVFVAIQEAQDDPVAVARLEAAASRDGNNDPLVITADSYAEIDAGEIADLLNAIREAAAAGLLPPVVIDLDGDGAEFDDIENGIQFDVDGDGELEQVAWADEDDAVLVYDANDNNQIDSVDEISFAQYSDERGATDLDGLRHFDSNEDLILDANDDEFESFKLWQDRDGDGEVGEGEMMTLSEAGIESLELTSDGEAYYTAGGDVLVHGEAGVNYADGSKGILADSEFQYEELAGEDDSLEVVADDGQVIDVNEGGPAPDSEPTPGEILEGDGGQTTGPDMSGDEAGAPPTTSGDDDLAAADAAMS